MQRPSISVITLTRDRPELLTRAIQSVQTQQVDADVSHIVIGDDAPSLHTSGLAPQLEEWGVQVVNISRTRTFPSVSARLAALRNEGIRRSRSDWVAFLDDDNSYTPEHLSSLLSVASQSGASAVHSHRILLEPSGKSWEGLSFPWPCPGLGGEGALRWLSQEGVFVPESPIMRDKTPLSGGHPGTVDTSEWLVERHLCLEVPWPEDVTEAQEAIGIGEDGAWLRCLLAAGVMPVCSERPTLLYRLGGRYDQSNGYRESKGLKEIRRETIK